MKFRIYPYKQGSKSAKTLSLSLGGKVLKREGSKFVPRNGDVVINWGASALPAFGQATVLNRHTLVAGNKLATFKALQDGNVLHPPYTESKVEAARMAFPVVCRTKLRGHSGDGIVIATKEEELVDAPLYTQYVKKKDESRVHVLKDDAFFIQRKARKLDVPEPNWLVRNLEGGFVFVEAPEDEVPPAVITQAKRAVVAVGLDFGGVDVLWNEREEKAYVIEINAACGTEERTADKYAEAIHRYLAD